VLEKRIKLSHYNSLVE